MKGKNLLILVVLAAVLAGLAVLSSKDKSKTTPEIIGKPVLPNLPINDVEKIAVSTSHGALTLARENDMWVTPSKFSYPADFQKVKGILLKLSEMKIGQVMRLTDSQKAALKIVTPADGSTTNGGTLVELSGSKGAKLATILLGETRQRKTQSSPQGFEGMGGYPDGRYLSIDGGKQVYLVTDPLEDISVQAKDWLDTEILNVNGADVSDITITAPGKNDLRLVRKEPSKLEVEGLTADEEVDNSKLYGMESALSYLRFADVADPALTDAQNGMDKPTIFKLTTRKNQSYTVKIGSSPTNSAERYVRLEVTLKPADTNQPSAAEAGGTNAVAVAAKAADERKQLEGETQTLNGKIGKWTYLIESYKAESLVTTREALVKKKEPPKTEEKPKPEGGATEAAPTSETVRPAAEQKDAPAN